MEIVSTDWSITLNRTISETFEQIIFQEVESWESIAVLSDIPFVHYLVRIALDKPWTGNLVFLIPDELAGEIARELIEEENEQIREENIKDALNEIANTVAGRFMAETTPGSESFALGLPFSCKGQPGAKIVSDFASVNFFIHHLGAYDLYSMLEVENYPGKIG
jgi:CheY-specific phosphatase CheX